MRMRIVNKDSELEGSGWGPLYLQKKKETPRMTSNKHLYESIYRVYVSVALVRFVLYGVMQNCTVSRSCVTICSFLAPNALSNVGISIKNQV
jgi:hypothetical protein